ncbi:MAG: hypothetical protein WDW36_002823 [Sanguina aurantia]
MRWWTQQQTPAGSAAAGAPLARRSTHALITRCPYPHPSTGSSARAASRHIPRATSSGPDSMTAEEEDIYQQFLNQKKQQRVDAQQAAKRRDRFDPMAATPDEAVAVSQPRAVAPRSTPASRPSAATRTIASRAAAAAAAAAAAVRATPGRRLVSIKRQSGRQLTSTLQREQAELAAAEGEEAEEDGSEPYLDNDADGDVDDDEDGDFSELGDDMDEFDLAALEQAASQAMQDADVPDVQILLAQPDTRSPTTSSSSNTFATRPDITRQPQPTARTTSMPTPTPSSSAPAAKPSRTFTLPSAMPAAAVTAAAAPRSKPAAPAAVAVPVAPPPPSKRAAVAPAATSPPPSSIIPRRSTSMAKPVARPVSSLADVDGEDEDDEEEEDGLDWEALAVYDSFEKYVDEVSKEAEEVKESRQSLVASSAAAAAKGRLRTASTASQPTPSTSIAAKPQLAPTPTPAAAAAAAALKTSAIPVSKQPTTAPTTSSASTTAAQLAARLPAAAAAAAVASSSRSAIPAKSGSKPMAKQKLKEEARSTLDAQLDEMEELFKFFELVENSGSAAAGKKPNRPSAPGAPVFDDWSGAGATGSSKVRHEDVDWAVVERAFLGEGWEAELMDLESSAARTLESAAEEGEGEAEGSEAEPWADEVTNLLLGLVGIAHKRYLGTALLPTGVAEEDRAAAYWDAPFAVLVQDDSKAACLEYANKQALTLLGWEFLDVYEKSSFDMVDTDPDQQQEWAWAVSEVEAAERFEKFSVVPEMRMTGPGGVPFTAKDVLLFRIDSLEGDAIGQAIVFKTWST